MLADNNSEATSDLFSNPGQKEEIKESKPELELKISGEQNRVLLSNIRPSFYREKNEAPTLAHYDDSAKMSTSFFKSTATVKRSFNSND